MSWLISLPCTRDEAEALSGEVPALDALADAPVVVTREIDEAAGRWQLDAYVETRPGADLLTLLQALVPSAKGVKPSVEQLPDKDLLALSRHGLEPGRAGRCFVNPRTPAQDVPAGANPFLMSPGPGCATLGHDPHGGARG